MSFARNASKGSSWRGARSPAREGRFTAVRPTPTAILSRTVCQNPMNRFRPRTTAKRLRPRKAKRPVDKTLDKFLAYLKVEKNYSTHTLTSYTHDLREFYKFLGERRIESMEILALRQYLALLRNDNLSKRTVARRMAVLRSYFKFLTREGYLKKNPMGLLRTPKLEKKLPMVLDENEISRLIDSPDEDVAGRRDRAILETLYSTGMRVSELVQLDLERVDFIGGSCRVMGKGGKERLCPT